MKISYWGTFDGQVIRSIEGSLDSEINCLAVSKEGEVFVSAGNDRQVKLWGYDDGHCYRIGVGHAGPVNKVGRVLNRSPSLQTKRPSCQLVARELSSYGDFHRMCCSSASRLVLP